MYSIFLFCLIPWFASGGEEKITSDVVQLVGGQRLSGRVLFEGRDALIVKSGRGEVEVERSDVAEIHSIERSLADFIKRFDAMPRENLAAVLELARWCEVQKLNNEAHNLFLRAVLGDPTNAEALKACGGRNAGKKVQLRNDKRWLDVEEFRAQKPKWRDGLHFATAHFDIETDVGLDKLLDVSVQLERNYLRFYQALGPELVLYVFEERPTIRIYANAKDFPQSWSGGDNTWFAPGENVLHLLTGERYDMQQISRAVTDMLLFNACRRSSGKTGQVPGWIACAIGEFFAATAPSVPFGPWEEFGKPVQGWFRLQAGDLKPIELKTLLRSSLGEMRRGPDAERRTAAAYTLGHFLVRGDGGAHRDALFAYLRGAWLGKISSNDFLKTINLSEAELSKRWREHVTANAR